MFARQFIRTTVSTTRHATRHQKRQFSQSPFSQQQQQQPQQQQSSKSILSTATADNTATPAPGHPLPWEDSALLGKHAGKGATPPKPTGPSQMTGEINGPSGPEPTRYGDYERAGRCYDF